METKSLPVASYALTAAVLATVFKFSILPSLVSVRTGRDAWITIAVIAAMELITLVPVVFVSFNGGLQSVKEKYGLPVYLLISVPVSALAVTKTLIYISEVNSFCGSYLFYNVSTENLGIVFAAAAAFIAVTGIKGISRAATIAVWTIPLIFAVGWIFGESSADFSRLTPVGVTGIGGLSGGVDSALFFAFDLSPLMFVSTGVHDEKRSPLNVFAVMGLIYAAVILFFAAFTAVFGEAYYLSPHAFAGMGSFNVVNTEIGAVDWPAIVAWLSFALIQISFQIWSVSAAFSYIIKPQITSAVVAAIAASGGFIFKNLEFAINFAESAVKYVSAAVAAISAAAAAILIKIKPKAEVNEVENATCV